MSKSPSAPSGRRFDVTLAGETNLDLILYGLPEQMPVERELLATDFQLTLGGSSSILAHNLAVLGSSVGFITQVGQDEMGTIALKRMQDAGVDLSSSSRRDDKSTGVTIVLPHGKIRHILTHLGVMDQMTTDDLDIDYLTSSQHFHLSSLFLQTGLQPGLPQLLSVLKAKGLTISLDTNDDPADKWGGVLDDLLDLTDVLLPNEDEVKRITRTSTLTAALDALAGRVPITVVKCGSRGALVQQGRAWTWIDSILVDPIDTIGAGDSFNAGFLHAFTRGTDPVTAAKLAVVTGALSTLKPGGTEAFRDAAFVRAFLQQHEIISPKLCASCS
jgi:sugar/nucleoside kinase (ribokinase family)